MPPKSLEQQLFEWDGWDQGGTAEFTFYNAVLKQMVGKYDVGHKFQCVNMNYEKAMFSAWEFGNESGKPDFQCPLIIQFDINALS